MPAGSFRGRMMFAMFGRLLGTKPVGSQSVLRRPKRRPSQLRIEELEPRLPPGTWDIGSAIDVNGIISGEHIYVKGDLLVLSIDKTGEDWDDYHEEEAGGWESRQQNVDIMWCNEILGCKSGATVTCELPEAGVYTFTLTADDGSTGYDEEPRTYTTNKIAISVSFSLKTSGPTDADNPLTFFHEGLGDANKNNNTGCVMPLRDDSNGFNCKGDIVKSCVLGQAASCSFPLVDFFPWSFPFTNFFP
jgi:hypothetical protein